MQENSLKCIQGKKIRRQGFNIPLIILYSMMFAIPYCIFAISWCVGKLDTYGSPTTFGTSVLLCFLFSVPFLVLRSLNKHFFGKIICVLDEEGIYYANKGKLCWDSIEKIEYVIDSYCDVKFFRRNKYKYVNLLEENNKFYKLINGCSFMSHKYAIDSFGEIILFFNIREKNKYWCFEISMDAEKIIYHWE